MSYLRVISIEIEKYLELCKFDEWNLNFVYFYVKERPSLELTQLLPVYKEIELESIGQQFTIPYHEAVYNRLRNNR